MEDSKLLKDSDLGKDLLKNIDWRKDSDLLKDFHLRMDSDLLKDFD